MFHSALADLFTTQQMNKRKENVDSITFHSVPVNLSCIFPILTPVFSFSHFHIYFDALIYLDVNKDRYFVFIFSQPTRRVCLLFRLFLCYADDVYLSNTGSDRSRTTVGGLSACAAAPSR